MMAKYITMMVFLEKKKSWLNLLKSSYGCLWLLI